MLDPNRDYYTFGEIAEYWPLEPDHVYSEEQIRDQLLASFWLGKFNPENLGWNERRARLDLYPDDPYDPELRSGHLLPDVADAGGRPSDFQPMSPMFAFSFLKLVQDPLWPSLSDTSGRPNFPQLAEAKFSRFSEKGRVILENIAITRSEFRRWCEVRGVPPPKFIEPPIPQEAQERPEGRPTLKTKIESAYETLKAAGKIDFDAPKARLYEPIRAKVQEMLGVPAVPKGLGKEAMRKVISPLFDADKAARNT